MRPNGPMLLSKAGAPRNHDIRLAKILDMSTDVSSPVGKAAEGRLRHDEEQFRLLFEQAPVAYHEIDRRGIIQRVNQAECHLLGYRADEIVGHAAWEFVAPEEQAKSREAVRRKMA